MKLTQNLNRWMNSDGSPLQGKLAAGLIKETDQRERSRTWEAAGEGLNTICVTSHEGLAHNKAWLRADSWQPASSSIPDRSFPPMKQFPANHK
ncbi:hypothetical protein DY000_02008076 [Brassica cretica]|uniref:Uncharacterized protein n=1 Tax=Brassica cretica TaxID=69181 RepID=A0ABQ7BUJ4_BRACR|nr:hypothetical protein DY000_02008076 [Brassica cretica]